MHGSWRLAACTIGVLILALVPSAPAAEPTEKGWVDFVTGKDLSFWKHADSHWRVEDGVLVCETEEQAPGTRIRSQVRGKWDDLPWGHFMDAEIELDVRFTGDVDAAIVPRKGGLRLWLGSCGRDPEKRIVRSMALPPALPDG
jgi:hypothetical protein